MRRLLRINATIMTLILVFAGQQLDAQSAVELSIFVDEDTLTIYVPEQGTVSLANISLQVTVNRRNLRYSIEDFPAFGIDFQSLPTPICFRLERDTVSRSLPLACQNALTLTQELANADVFWHDARLNTSRTLSLLQDTTVLAFCPANEVACEMTYVPPLATATATAEAQTAELTPIPSPTPEPASTDIVSIGRVQVPAGANLHVRGAPQSSAVSIALLPADANVDLTGQVDPTGDWLQVRLENGNVGWVVREYIEIVSAPEISVTELPTESDLLGIVIDPSGLRRSLNVRQGPGTEFAVIAQLDFGELVVLTRQTDDTGEWLVVTLGDGRTGWVSGEYIETFISPDMTAIAQLSPHVTVSIPNLNVRQGDSTAFGIIGTLSQGQTAPIVGISSRGTGWYQVRLSNGLEGWVSPSVVSVTGDVSNLPLINPPPLP